MPPSRRTMKSFDVAASVAMPTQAVKPIVR